MKRQRRKRKREAHVLAFKKKKGRARQAEENKTKMTCDVLTGSTGCHTDPHTVALFAKGKKKKKRNVRVPAQLQSQVKYPLASFQLTSPFSFCKDT